MRRPVVVFRSLVWFVLAWLSAGYVPAHAATIYGVVSEAEATVDDVEMVLINADSNVVLAKVRTGADGGFRFTVDSGTFNVVAFKPDYVSVWTRGIKVGADDVSLRVELLHKAFTDNYSGASDGDCN